MGTQSDSEPEGDVAVKQLQGASDVAGRHTKIVLAEVSVKKPFVVPSADVDDSLDFGPEDCDEADNVLNTGDEVHVNGVPYFLAFVAHGRSLNMHG